MLNSKKILVCIPTLNAQPQLGMLLGGLKGVDVLVVDSSSVDKTIDIARSHNVSVKTIHRDGFNHATTRNSVLEYDDYDFYCFLTQDALPKGDTSFADFMVCFEDKDIVVAYATQLPREDSDPIERFARTKNYPEQSSIVSKSDIQNMGIRAFFCSNSCAMCRADYFRQVGGFTDGLLRNEDMEFAARAILNGKKKAYCANVHVEHSHHTDILEIAKRYYEIGKFFKQNKWILEAATSSKSVESEGLKHVFAELLYIMRNAPAYIPKSIICIIVKFIAYKVGLR